MAEDKFTRSDLDELIKELFGIAQVTPMIQRQINNYVIEYRMTFKEIARCLVYYVEVEKGQLKLQYGIAVAVNLREPAAKYFKQLELDQQRQARESEKVKEYQDNNVIFQIKPQPSRKRQPKQFDISEINVEGEDK